MGNINIEIKKENDRKYLILHKIPEDAEKELGGLPIIGSFVDNDGWSFVPNKGMGFTYQLHYVIHKLFVILKEKGTLDAGVLEV